MCNTWRNVFLQSMKNNTLSVKKLMKNLILRTLRQLYAVSEIIILIRWVTPPPKVENLQFEFFLSFSKFLSCACSSTLHCLHCFRCFSSLAIYIWVYVLYNIHLLLFLQVGFLLSECDRTLPLYAILNPICSQILHVRSIWNSFKIFTVSLSAEEIANGTLKPILSKFSALPLKPFRIPRYTYSLTHDLTRSPPLTTWVTHVMRMRRVRGTFVQFLRASSFSPWL